MQAQAWAHLHSANKYIWPMIFDMIYVQIYMIVYDAHFACMIWAMFHVLPYIYVHTNDCYDPALKVEIIYFFCEDMRSFAESQWIQVDWRLTLDTVTPDWLLCNTQRESLDNEQIYTIFDI